MRSRLRRVATGVTLAVGFNPREMVGEYFRVA
jgi:hypothetical protein